MAVESHFHNRDHKENQLDSATLMADHCNQATFHCLHFLGKCNEENAFSSVIEKQKFTLQIKHLKSYKHLI